MPRPPVDLPPFRVLYRAGLGGTATVWRGEHRRLAVPVAIKIVTAAGGEALGRAFAREVRAVARLDHPGIIRVHDHDRLPADAAAALGHPPGAPYLVMDWCAGGTLAERCGAMPWPAVRAALLAVLDALALAHARGVIHRDLKPSNVLLADGRPVIADFGLGFEPVERPGGAHVAWGTPGFMAPEQLTGAWWRFGPATDLYAVGCTAWALVTGRSPFHATDPQATRRRQLDDRPAIFAPATPVPPGFEAWLRRLLARDPDERPRFAAHAAEALAALPDAADGPPIAAHAPPLPATAGPTLGPELPPDPAPAAAPAPAGPSTPRAALPDCGRSLAELRDPRLRGRDAAGDALWRAFEAVCAARRPAAIVLEGPAGMGKTRLALWLARRAHRAGRADTLLATHQPDPGPDGGLGPMLARHLRLAGLPPAEREARLRALSPSAAEAAALAAALDPAGRGEVAGHRVRLTSADARRPILIRALRRLAESGPRIVIIDDAHHAPEAVALVEQIIARGRGPLLFVLTARSAPRVAAPRIALDPLPADAIAAIVDDRVILAADTRARLIDHVRGNPAFADELVRHWLAADLLVPGPAGHRLRPGAALEAGPAALWRARMARSEGDGAAAFEVAAALGVAVVDAEWRAACAEAGLTPPAEGVERLYDAGLARPAPDGWRFVHAALRDAVLARARDAGRAIRWHRACAAALSATAADPRRIAAHHGAAGDLDAAWPAWMTAWQHTRRRGSPEACRRCLIDAARVARRLGEGPDGPRFNTVRVWWTLLQMTTGASASARRHGDRALAIARARGDAAQTAWAMTIAAQIRSNTDSPEAIALLRAAAEVHPAPADDPELACTRRRWLGDLLLFAGDLPGARVALAEAETHAARLPGGEARAYVQLRRAEVELYAGDLDAAAAAAARAEAAATASGDRFGMAQVAMTGGLIARRLGRIDDAFAAQRRARDAFAVLGHHNEAVAECNLALLHLDEGALDAAREAAERGRARAIEMGDTVYRVFADLTLLPVLGAAGDRGGWDESWRAIAELVPRLGLKLAEAGDMLDRGAARALEAGWPARARAAWTLAAAQFDGCGEPARAAEARAAAARLSTR